MFTFMALLASNEVCKPVQNNRVSARLQTSKHPLFVFLCCNAIAHHRRMLRCCLWDYAQTIAPDIPCEIFDMAIFAHNPFSVAQINHAGGNLWTSAADGAGSRCLCCS